jgi:hypothetical protein
MSTKSFNLFFSNFEGFCYAAVHMPVHVAFIIFSVMQKPFIKCVIRQRVGRFLHIRKKLIRRFQKKRQYSIHSIPAPVFFADTISGLRLDLTQMLLCLSDGPKTPGHHQYDSRFLLLLLT